ncbi:Trk system potassium transporter TrkA [Roseicyclus mahoneyensis]|uniref:Trk system potassium uptake protein TrkA n=1 Tax=Roseicyclus mahoneyensis TaxID=164332 RepID=A0A316GSP3_9RHOB|nr:Trk system potassium transporter TrkA [Roseicyclus mahoneyensis]PWK62626.1 trk system potassium uptake protein TrkA [Roseicyclus mahoneyensis]
MKVIICGAGQVGWQIARHLSGENNDVTVVDNNPDLVRRATDTLDVQGLTGFASYPDVLEKAGARDADMIIAATFSDEVNMVTCQVAHSVFAVPRKIARLRARSYLDAIYSDLYRRDHLPIDVVISPEEEVAQAALARIRSPSTFDTESFLSGDARMLGIQLDADCPVLETPLRQLSELFSTLRAIVVGVRRKGTLFAPEPGDQLFAGDQIYVFTHTQDAGRTLEIFGKTAKRPERVLIIGGGNVGLNVARALEQGADRVRTRVIEKSRARAEVAADALERTIVLNGDGLDMDILREAGIDRVDAVLCVTDDDKTNLLTSVRAKSAGAGLAIALVNDPSLLPMMGPLGIDAHINPRASTVSSILRHIRHGRVRGVYSIGDAEAEVIEAQVLSTSSIAGRQIRDIDFPEGALVAAVQKGGKVVRPSGTLRLEEGDSIVIFALAADVPAVETLLQVSIDFF